MSRITEEEIVIDSIVVESHQAIPHILPVDVVVQWVVTPDVVTAVYHELLSEVSLRVPAVEVSLVAVLELLPSFNTQVRQFIDQTLLILVFVEILSESICSVVCNVIE